MYDAFTQDELPMPARIAAFREAHDKLVALLDQVDPDSRDYWTILSESESLEMGLEALEQIDAR